MFRSTFNMENKKIFHVSLGNNVLPGKKQNFARTKIIRSVYVIEMLNMTRSRKCGCSVLCVLHIKCLIMDNEPTLAYITIVP